MKRIIGIILCAALCFGTLCSCSANKKTVLTVGEAEIDSEIFAYFFSEAYSFAESNGGDLLAKDELMAQAVNKCLEYVASTTLFGTLQLSLSVDSKKNIASSVEDEWMLYGSYYTDAGISKQTVSKIIEAKEYRTQLLLYYFGEGSEYEVKEDEIEYYFDRTYVAFKAINGYFTTTDENGGTVPLPDAEIIALKDTFNKKRSQLEAGMSFAEINDGNDVEPTFIAVSNSAYPEGFLAQIAELEYDKPTVIETDEYIFLVVRMDAKEGSNNYYSTYRTKYVEDLRGEMLTDMLVATGEEYGVTQEDARIKSVAKDVISARNDRK